MTFEGLVDSRPSRKRITSHAEIVSDIPMFAGEFDEFNRLCGLFAADEANAWAHERARRLADYRQRVGLAPVMATDIVATDIMSIAKRRRGPIPPRPARRVA